MTADPAPNLPHDSATPESRSPTTAPGTKSRRTTAAPAHSPSSPSPTPAFDGLYYGTRPDTESYNGDAKARLPNRRCRSVTQNRVMFDLAAYNLRTAFRAIAYHMRHHRQRTYQEWFGNHQLPQDL